MNMQLYKRLKSERGATISFGLLVFFVCVSVSAILLAAATTAAGVYANLGVADQRYYAVTSAAQLFRDSLNADGSSATYTITQTRTGTKNVTRKADGTTVGGDSTPAPNADGAAIFESDAETTPIGYDFLPAITCFAFTGKSGQGTSITSSFESISELKNILKTSPSWDAWVQEFQSSSGWNGKDHKDLYYELHPTGVPTGAQCDVNVQARLWNNWTLELVFYNTADAKGRTTVDSTTGAVLDTKKNDCYFYYLSFVGDVETNDYSSEAITSTTLDESGNSVSNVTVSQSHEVKVTWHLRNIVPGKGLS